MNRCAAVNRPILNTKWFGGLLDVARARPRESALLNALKNNVIALMPAAAPQPGGPPPVSPAMFHAGL